MSSETYPLQLPEDLLEQIREAAKATGLSMADVMRLAIRKGLPQVLEDIKDGWVKI